MVDRQPRLTFPKKFLWGAATSAHQVEGNTHNQWTVWELENAKSKAAQAAYHFGDLESWPQIEAEATDPNNYVSGVATDHYNKYETDFDLAKKLNLNAFRFSIEWSRVEPEEGAWNVEAIEHYRQYILALKKREIEPIVTLLHFTLPVWFTALGGFEKRSNVQYFVRFVDKIMRELGTHVRFVVTINEAETYAYESYYSGNWPPNQTSLWKLWRVLNNLAYAHNQAATTIHAINRRFKVAIVDNSSYVYAGDDAVLSRKTADVLQYFKDDYFLKKVIKTCDFLGTNYYFSDRVYGYRVHNPDVKVSDTGYDMSPENLEYALERLYEKYKLPILIAESGVADSQDQYRQWWVTQTLIAMQKAMDNGVVLEGYLHWSLTDNFEWDKGRWPRYGLIGINYATLERTVRPSALWFSKVIKHLRQQS